MAYAGLHTSTHLERTVRKIVGFWFPWRKTFRQLELQKRWWHRLAIVLFFTAIGPVFLISWAIGNRLDPPFNFVEGDIQCWEILPTPPRGFTPDQPVTPATPPPDASFVGQGRVAVPMKDASDKLAAQARKSESLKTVEMPDGTTATYPGTLSDETINAEWRHKLNMAEVQQALLGFGIAVLMTIASSYLIQAAYRLLLYVIFGAKAKNVPEGPGDGA